MQKMNVKTITRLALTLALIIVIELLEGSFLNMPQGGSISLSSMVFVLSLMLFSFTESVVLFILWRVVMLFLVPPFYVNLLQLALDYIVSYASFLVVYPLIKKEKYQSIILAILLANVWRYFVHVATGMIYFAEYAEDTPLLQYSLIYNLTYMGPTVIVQLILGNILTPFVKRIEKANRNS